MSRDRPYLSTSVLLADDEPEHLGWLVDYFASKNLTTAVVTNVADAVKAAEAADYRCYIIDLNIPFGDWKPAGPDMGPTYGSYKGLHIAQRVRSLPNSGARVVAYSAHTNEQITSEIERLYCKYVVKGRPRELKDEIEAILRHDPRTVKRPRRAKKARRR